MFVSFSLCSLALRGLSSDCTEKRSWFFALCASGALCVYIKKLWILFYVLDCISNLLCRWTRTRTRLSLGITIVRLNEVRKVVVRQILETQTTSRCSLLVLKSLTIEPNLWPWCRFIEIFWVIWVECLASAEGQKVIKFKMFGHRYPVFALNNMCTSERKDYMCSE